MPVIQALCATTAARRWASDSGRARRRSTPRCRSRSPSSTGASSASPISFKEPLDGDVAVRGAALRARPRALRAAGAARRRPRAAAHAGPRASSAPRSCCPRFPTKHARIGNAVGLDTPASAMVLLDALQAGRPPRRARLRRRRRAHPRADRRRRPRPGVPHRRRSCTAPPRACRSPTTSSGSTRCPTQLREADDRDVGPGARRVVRRRRRLRGRRPRPRQRLRRHPAAARLRREPGRDLPRPRPRARPPLPRDLPLARPAAAPTRSSTSASTARSSGCRARRSGSSAACAPDAVPGGRAALLPVRRQRPRRGHAGQAPRPRRRSSTTSCRR